MTYEEIDSFYPGLIMELVAHPGVGIVGVKTKEGLMILSKDGTRNLDTDEITGSDPLIMYEKPELRAKQLRTLMNYKSVGDLVIISPVYEDGTVAGTDRLPWRSRRTADHTVPVLFQRCRCSEGNQ